MIGQHAPRLEATRPPAIHPRLWLVALGIVVIALAIAVGVLVGIELWGGVQAPTGAELQHSLWHLRTSIPGGGFI